jgi:hypothetical protein
MKHTRFTGTSRVVPILAAGLLMALGASQARADNAYTSLTAYTCSPYIVGDCLTGTSSTGIPRGLNVGEGFAFASGWNGGFVMASAGFDPGAPTLLADGTYKNVGIAQYGYTFQVQGQPNTYVPLHIFGRLSIAPIHMSAEGGGVATLVEGAMGQAPNPSFLQIDASAHLQIGDTHPHSDTLPHGANASIESLYQGTGGGSCRNCSGNVALIDQTILVWSNSNITVDLAVAAGIIYSPQQRDGNTIFANIEAEVDPVFTIDDPAYAGFSIVGVSTGEPPPDTAAVPEPATWALMLSGLGLMGCAALRRR